MGPPAEVEVGLKVLLKVLDHRQLQEMLYQPELPSFMLEQMATVIKETSYMYDWNEYSSMSFLQDMVMHKSVTQVVVNTVWDIYKKEELVNYSSVDLEVSFIKSVFFSTLMSKELSKSKNHRVIANLMKYSKEEKDLTKLLKKNKTSRFLKALGQNEAATFEMLKDLSVREYMNKSNLDRFFETQEQQAVCRQLQKTFGGNLTDLIAVIKVSSK